MPGQTELRHHRRSAAGRHGADMLGAGRAAREFTWWTVARWKGN